MIEHGVTEPYRTGPPANPRFFVSEDHETFIDLNEVTIAYWREKGDYGSDLDDVEDMATFVEFWLRGIAESFNLLDELGREFMDALIAYRKGTP